MRGLRLRLKDFGGFRRDFVTKVAVRTKLNIFVLLFFLIRVVNELVAAVINLVFKLMLSRGTEDLVHIIVLAKVSLVCRLVNHDVAGLVVSMSVFDHIGAGVDSRVAVDAQVVHE